MQEQKVDDAEPFGVCTGGQQKSMQKQYCDCVQEKMVGLGLVLVAFGMAMWLADGSRSVWSVLMPPDWLLVWPRTG